ncbi:MAG: tripartite tricarboxylate transporter permease [Spirochaetales bacterium]|nr:tripartite tricarboxylate transporter permease [Spirochaetales bacterium]
MIGQVLSIVFNPTVLLCIFLGVGGGICIGALPGLTSTMGVALLLPLTFGMDAQNGILLLLGIYIGAVYGGSISAILLHTPGTPASAATVIDGYEFSKRGEGGRALGISTLSSFIGGVVSCLMLMLISPQLAKLALRFSDAEYALLAIFGLSIILSVSGKSLMKGLIAGCVGFILSMVGVDRITGNLRFTFGSVNMIGGISYVPVMIGLFAMSQCFNTVEEMTKKENRKPVKISKVFPKRDDLKVCLKYAPISGLIGTFIGIIPGAGTEIGAFVSYNLAKNMSKNPEKFGTGVPEGIAAPEGGNNGVTGGAMIPMLTLGVPGDSVAAIMIGALTIQGLQPGPLLFRDQKPLMFAIFIGLFVANCAMLFYGMSCQKLFAKVLSIPKEILTPIIFVLCVIGSYALNNSFFDVGLMLVFGIIGYFMNKAEVSVSPMMLGMILGSMAELHFRTALVKSDGGLGIFVGSPIAIIFLILTIVSFGHPVFSKLLKSLKNKKEKDN